VGDTRGRRTLASVIHALDLGRSSFEFGRDLADVSKWTDDLVIIGARAFRKAGFDRGPSLAKRISDVAYDARSAGGCFSR
jgi:hypothetical protein